MTPKRLRFKIEVKRLTTYLSILPVSALCGLGMLVVCSFCLWGLVPDVQLLVWIGLALVVFSYSLVLSFLFKRKRQTNRLNIEAWQWYLSLNSALSGILWGVAAALFYPQLSGESQPFVLLAAVMLLSSYFPVLVHYFLGFSIFSISLILPIVIQIAIVQSPPTPLTGVVLLVYLIVMLIFARWFNQREFERFRLQIELLEQNDKVIEANESKSRFLASASHDLRQPLQALGFYIVMLSDFLREPSKKALFDKTLKAYRALEDLLNQLLNISKLNANLVDIVHTDFSIEQLFEKLRNDYEMRAIDRGLTIEFSTGDYFAYSDVVSVERILRNLLENSLRYTKRGYIKATCQKEQGKLLLKVADSGIGIEKIHLKRIFDEFYQVKNPERDRSKGFGLGLYAVQRLAELLDTRIKVESEVGKGSVFTIALPIGKAFEELQRSQTKFPIQDGVLADKIVLLVDDDDVVLDSISRLFLSWGCQILTADSYSDGLKMITQEEIIPELLVVDYRLPNHQTGVQLVKHIRKLSNQSVPAIILTGDTGEESLAEINQSGLDFMHKPADPAQLKKKVKRLLLNVNAEGV